MKEKTSPTTSKGNFYIDITSSGNWWELEVEDYY
jgi:hypothetical protein